MLSEVFFPKPGNSATRPSLQAFSNSGTVVTPSVSHSALIFFGPSPCSSNIANNPGGNSAFRLSKYASCPVATSSVIFSAIALPTPGISPSSPSAAAATRSPG